MRFLAVYTSNSMCKALLKKIYSKWLRGSLMSIENKTIEHFINGESF